MAGNIYLTDNSIPLNTQSTKGGTGQLNRSYRGTRVRGWGIEAELVITLPSELYNKTKKINLITLKLCK